MPDPAHPLTQTLGAPLPDEFGRLTEADLAELDRLLRTAVSARGERLGAAVESSLQLIPRLMRPAVKKALGL
ncbi:MULTISPECIES: hypothetical protein [Nocardia]|uniref:Uncharacterized protein n=2 Tax=Nocardia TaxID=1817 RepID=K0F2R7_NOCB7|nr:MULTISPECIES: hypothetical protein [Nocardia]AFU01916.1 hypothetical protein O3I_019785 [Nocardia brasiliensis ATCC 700358]KIA60001.1 hypothetical protein FG87_39785 [Nocardia vulneris]MBF6542111.1 hypothetical protein [Nocardia brasiliensis]OCF89372.1 hypothetical protein AW168_17275 [Nocardia brasiliensis]